MRAFRWPALVAIPAVMVAAAQYDADHRPEPVTALESALPSSLASVVLDRPASWFCVAGRADDAHEVTIVNVGDEPAQGTVSVFGVSTSTGAAVRPEPVTDDIVVEAGGRVSLPLAEALPGAEWLSAGIEIEGGEVVVTHSVSGENGGDSEPCADRGSNTWYEPWGTTVLGAEMSLVLFNPFPEDAVVDITFATENGVREPPAFQSVVVPGRSVVPLEVGGTETRDPEEMLADGQLDEADVDLGGPVAVAERVSAAVTARSGRVIVERVQDLDPAEADRLQGLAIGLPAPATAEAWVFPTGRLVEGLSSRLVVYNPSEVQAEVDVEVVTGSAVPVEPFELSILPRQAVAVDLADEARMDEVTDYSLIVRSVNSVPVVASRVDSVLTPEVQEAPVPTTTVPLPIDTTTTVAPEAETSDDAVTDDAATDDAATDDAATDEAAADTTTTTIAPTTTTTAPASPASDPGGTAFELVPGVAVSHGTATLATRQIMVLRSVTGGTGSELALLNPDFSGPARVTIRVLGEGAATDELAVEVAAGSRATVDLDELGTGDLVLVLESTLGVAAEADQLGITSRLLVPSVPAAGRLVAIPAPSF